MNSIEFERQAAPA